MTHRSRLAGFIIDCKQGTLRESDRQEPNVRE